MDGVMEQKFHILLPVHTVADWGGLQDWTVGMVKGLVANGATVTLVSNNSRIINECRGYVAGSYLVDWNKWDASAKRIAKESDFDIIFAQPFKSRELALELRRMTGAPVVYMFHGNNSDYAYLWKDEVQKFLVASSSLIPMLTDFCQTGSIPIEVLPNGVPSKLFLADTVGYETRMAEGSYDFVLAARLMPDKISQVEGLVQIASTLLDNGIIPRASVHVMGGGPSRGEFQSRLNAFADRMGVVDVQFHGWVPQSTVLDYLRAAVFSVAGGVTGAQSVALGTPCLGAGIRGICGVSTPNNIDRVLGSNFGDHSARLNMTKKEIITDCQAILSESNFESFQNAYVPLMREQRTHEAIAALALDQILDAYNSVTY